MNTTSDMDEVRDMAVDGRLLQVVVCTAKARGFKPGDKTGFRNLTAEMARRLGVRTELSAPVLGVLAQFVNTNQQRATA